MSAPHLEHLAKVAAARRRALGLSQQAAAAAYGLSGTTLGKTETAAGRASKQTLAMLDPALQWELGSARGVDEEGGEPIEVAGLVPSESTSPAAWAAGAARANNEGIYGPDGPVGKSGSALAARLLITDEPARACADAEALARIRTSLRENIGKGGATPDLVRTVAARRLGDVVDQLTLARRARVVEVAYRLLDEQEAKDGGMTLFGDSEWSGVSDLATWRGSNNQGHPVPTAVDDEDPTAGINPVRYAAHPRTEPLEEDTPTP